MTITICVILTAVILALMLWIGDVIIHLLQRIEARVEAIALELDLDGE